MTRQRLMSRQSAVGLTALAGATLLIALPLVIHLARGQSTLTSGNAIDFAHASYPLTAPVRLPVPGRVTIEQGSVQSGDAPGVERAQSDPARIIVDDGLFVVGPVPGSEGAMPNVTTLVDDADRGDVIIATRPIASALARVAFDTLEIRRGTVRVRGESGRKHDIENVNLTVTAKGKTAVSFAGTVEHSGRAVRLDATLGKSAENSLGMPLKLAIKGAGIDAAVEGRLSVDNEFLLDGPAELNVTKVRKLAALLGVDLPADILPQNLKIRGNLRWSPRGITFDRASFSFDGNVATGALSIALSGERPALMGTLAFSTLALTKESSDLLSALWPRLGGTGTEESASSSGSVMRQFDADMRLSAAQLTIGKMALGGAAVSLVLKGGKLLADIAELELASGKAVGQVALDTTRPAARVAVRLKASDIDIAALTGPEWARTALDGRVNIVADLHATGLAIGELINSLSGKLHIAMPTGGRMGADGRAAVSMAQRQDIYGWTAPLRAPTAFDELEVRLIGNDGHMRVEGAKLRVGEVALAGDGAVSLRTGHLDLKLYANASDPADRGVGSVTPENIAIGAAASVSGPWRSPSIRAIRHVAQPLTDAGTPPATAPRGPVSVIRRDPG
jgi:hypothetical protein